MQSDLYVELSLVIGSLRMHLIVGSEQGLLSGYFTIGVFNSLKDMCINLTSSAIFYVECESEAVDMMHEYKV